MAKILVRSVSFILFLYLTLAKSNLTDRNFTVSDIKNGNINSNLLRILLNQETIIRVELEKKVHELIQDVETLKKHQKSEESETALPHLASTNVKEKNSTSTDCADILKKNPKKKNQDGVYTIVLDEHTTKQVYCDMSTEGGGWTVFQRRFNGCEDFYRNWRDYKYGFGKADQEYWLGNDVIHILTKNGNQELRVDIQRFNGSRGHVKCPDFSICDESKNYRLSVGSCKGNAGDSLKRHNGMMFSTKDNENDIDSTRNCAVKYKGAWWYKNCHDSNLNGHYYPDGKISTDGMTWTKWNNDFASLKSSKMMIRPKS